MWVHHKWKCKQDITKDTFSSLLTAHIIRASAAFFLRTMKAAVSQTEQEPKQPQQHQQREGREGRVYISINEWVKSAQLKCAWLHGVWTAQI